MTSKTLLVIDVNSRASVLSRQTGPPATRETVIEAGLPWVIERVARAEHIRSVVVLMNSADARLMATRVPSVATVIASDESNGLKRLLMAAEAFDAEAIVKVDFEAPLVDCSLVDMLMEFAEQNPNVDYVSFREGSESDTETAGKYVEWCRVSALREAGELEPLPGRSATRVLHGYPERFEVRYLKLTTPEDRSNLMVRMDSPQEVCSVKDLIAKVEMRSKTDTTPISTAGKQPD